MTADSTPERIGGGRGTGRALRPDALGTRHAVAAGHPLAALAAFRGLEAGGDAAGPGGAGRRGFPAGALRRRDHPRDRAQVPPLAAPLADLPAGRPAAGPGPAVRP